MHPAEQYPFPRQNPEQQFLFSEHGKPLGSQSLLHEQSGPLTQHLKSPLHFPFFVGVVFPQHACFPLLEVLERIEERGNKNEENRETLPR
jgi:hypothetical protein